MPNDEDKKDGFDYIKPFTSKIIKPLIDWVFSSKLHAIFVLLMIVLSIFLINMIAGMLKKVFIISLLILIGGISKIHQRYFKVQIGIELITLSTVVSGYVYGPLIGAVVGFSSFALSIYFTGVFSHSYILTFILVTIAGAVSPLFRDMSISAAGIIITIIYNIIFIPIYIGWFRGRYSKIILFAFTQIVWNIWVFNTIAPYVVSILK